MRDIKKLLLAALLPLALLTAVGCVEEYSEPAEAEPEGEPEGTPEGEPEGEPESPSTLALTYIAGHFGSYRDCPEEAFNPDEPDAPGDGARPDGIQEDPDGDCDESCGPLNCEAAQITLRVANTGDEALTGVNILEILIIDAQDFERASMPILSVTRTDGGGEFDGRLEAGQSVDIRVEFQGPLDITAILGADNDGDRIGGPEARLRVTLAADGQGEVSLDSPGLFSLPEVDT